MSLADCGEVVLCPTVDKTDPAVHFSESNCLILKSSVLSLLVGVLLLTNVMS